MTGGQRVVSLFFFPSSSLLFSFLDTNTLGLVTPASSQQRGQAGCTSQSQHYLSEQSISEEKQRRREKGRKRSENRETVRSGGKRGSQEAI